MRDIIDGGFILSFRRTKVVVRIIQQPSAQLILYIC